MKNNSQTSNLEAMIAEAKLAEEKLPQLRNQIKALENQVALRKTELNTQNDRLLERRKVELEELDTSYKANLDETKAEITNLTSSREAITKDLLHLQTTISEQKAVLDTIITQITEAQTEKLKAKENTEKLQHRADELYRLNSSANARISELESLRREVTIEVDSLISKRDSLKVEYDKSVQLFKDKTEKLDKQASEIEYKLNNNKNDLIAINKEATLVREDLATRTMTADKRETNLLIRERKVQINEQRIQANSDLLDM